MTKALLLLLVLLPSVAFAAVSASGASAAEAQKGERGGLLRATATRRLGANDDERPDGIGNDDNELGESVDDPETREPSKTPPPSGGTGVDECFSADATVQVLITDSQSVAVAMKDLQVGDPVLTGNNRYQPIYAFAHWNPSAETTFLRIQTSSSYGAPLEISPEHLVYMVGKKNPVRADAIKPGDVLQSVISPICLGNCSTTSIGQFRVEAISTVQKKGLYAPLTPHGTVVVDGIKASSYVSLQADGDSLGWVSMQAEGWVLPLLSQHDLLHYTLSPFRMICTSTLPAAALVCDSYDDLGYPYMIQKALKVARWVDGLHLVFQLGALVVWLMLLGPFMALESLLLAATSTSLFVVSLGATAGCILLATRLGVHRYQPTHTLHCSSSG